MYKFPPLYSFSFYSLTPLTYLKGLSGVPLQLFINYASGMEEPFAEIDQQVARAKKLHTESSLVLWLRVQSIEELVAAVESVAMTDYSVPDELHYPNWINICCGMSLVNQWMRIEACRKDELFMAKLKRVTVDVFNSKTLRFPKDDVDFNMVAVARTKLAHVVGDAFRNSAVPENVAFMTALEVAQNTLRETLTRYCWLYRVALIEGDGNCLFRAVVRGLCAHVPRDHEDALSLQLRKAVNSAEKGELKAFEVTDESDMATMSEAGVWADHVQIARVSNHLNRQLWLIRSDDENLTMGLDGKLIPAPHYCIGKGDRRPIRIFYQSAPGHFETILDGKEDDSLIEVLKKEPRKLLSIVDVYFRLESALIELEEMFARLVNPSIPPEVRQALRDEGESREAILKQHLTQFRALMGRQSLEPVRNDASFVLLGDLYRLLLQDGPNGPLQQLVARLDQFGPRNQNSLQSNSSLKLPLADVGPSREVSPLPSPRQVISVPKLGPKDDLSHLASTDSASSAIWDKMLTLMLTKSDKQLVITIKYSSLSEKSLSACWDALTLLYNDKRYRRSVHVALIECRLNDACCDLILKKPRHVSLVSLTKCAFDAEKYGTKFLVRQHVQVVE